MDVQEKLNQFSRVVFQEAENHRNKTLESIDYEYSKAVNSFEYSTTQKFKRRLEEETNKAKRTVQRDIVEAQSELKRELINKRTEQIEYIFENVRKKIAAYTGSDEYVNNIINTIKENNKMGSDTIVYIVNNDIHLKESIERETGVTVQISKVDFIGGIKMTISDKQLADFSIISNFDYEKSKFNKIRI